MYDPEQVKENFLCQPQHEQDWNEAPFPSFYSSAEVFQNVKQCLLSVYLLCTASSLAMDAVQEMAKQDLEFYIHK